jgi:hypothetical protein
LRENAYPGNKYLVLLLKQPHYTRTIVTIAFYLIDLYIPVGIKYFTIASTSMIPILALYEVFIRRVNILRFLFGLNPKIQ